MNEETQNKCLWREKDVRIVREDSKKHASADKAKGGCRWMICRFCEVHRWCAG